MDSELTNARKKYESQATIHARQKKERKERRAEDLLFKDRLRFHRHEIWCETEPTHHSTPLADIYLI